MTALTAGTPAPADAGHGVSDAADGLALGGIRVADYRLGDDLAPEQSPRPYLHPLRSLAGVALTEVAPADHPHHYGVSMAVADVDGTSHWGGRTFVRGSGSTLLDNHGRQRSVGRARADAASDRVAAGAGIDETLLWLDRHGRTQLTEVRSIRARPLPDAAGWQLSWTSVLTASEGEVRIGSPATNGRVGAGYGGIFWRLPNRAGTTVLSNGGAGEAVAHGSDSPWLVLNQTAAAAGGPSAVGAGIRRVSLLLSQPVGPVRPWFVRATEYVGAGPMLAAESVLTIAAGDSVTTSLAGVVLDRWVTGAADAEAILATAGLGSPGSPGAPDTFGGTAAVLS